ncbi:MAG: hypothetical protein QG564_54 [Campylobacterota bacterium]|nr:hypothetical protein [Campylobacterota bacterium]
MCMKKFTHRDNFNVCRFFSGNYYHGTNSHMNSMGNVGGMGSMGASSRGGRR